MPNTKLKLEMYSLFSKFKDAHLYFGILTVDFSVAASKNCQKYELIDLVAHSLFYSQTSSIWKINKQIYFPTYLLHDNEG